MDSSIFHNLKSAFQPDTIDVDRMHFIFSLNKTRVRKSEKTVHRQPLFSSSCIMQKMKIIVVYIMCSIIRQPHALKAVGYVITKLQ